MTSTLPATPELKAKLKATWMDGDYDRFSRYMEPGAAEIVERLMLPAGSRLLDVACGSGQLALLAAQKGAQVTGVDIATNLIERARERAGAAGLDVRFDEGDAEALPYADASFDSVTSLVGAMFAPRPDLVAAELMRVCRPGGTIAMFNWTPAGFIGQMFRAIAAHIAPSGMPSPVLWGDEATVKQRFGDGVSDIQFTRHDYTFKYPFPPSATVEFFRLNYGPMKRAFEGLTPSAGVNLRATLEELWSSHNRGGKDSTRVYAEYLQVIATRR